MIRCYGLDVFELLSVNVLENLGHNMDLLQLYANYYCVFGELKVEI